MNGRLILRVVLALLMLGVIFVIVRSAMAPDTPVKAAPPPKVLAAFAAIDLPQGLLIRPQDLSWTELPADARQRNHIVQGSQTANELVGAVVSEPIAAGDGISPRAIVLPSSPGFLSAALKPDMRAVSVPIDEVSGNAGLILPGDYVDLILTQALGSEQGPDHRIVSETVLSNVRIIAVGRTIRVNRAADDNEEEIRASAKARTTTLEVRPSEAEIVAVAARLGTLSLALRSLATLQRPEDRGIGDDTTTRTGAPVWGEDVSAARRLAVPEAPKVLRPAVRSVVRVIRGSKDAEEIRGDAQGSAAPTATLSSVR